MDLSIGTFRGRTNLLVLVSVLFIAVMLLPPVDAIENSNLTARMAECTLLVVYSVSLGYGLERVRTGPTTGPRPRRWGTSILLGALIPGAILAYWNYPPNFDATVTGIGIRYLADITYIGAGMLVGAAVTVMPRAFRAGVLLLGFLSVGMMGSMMLVWQPGFYTVYSPAQNLDGNTFLMGLGAVGVIVSGSWTLKVMDIV